MPNNTDTVPTMLTPGEFVIKRESAKMLGKPFLEKLNAVSDNSAHSNIDALISQATLSQMQPMLGGGVVNEYMGGGDVSNYMGGGDIDGYMYGGGIKKQMNGYQEGGNVDSEKIKVLDYIFNKLQERKVNKSGMPELEGDISLPQSETSSDLPSEVLGLLGSMSNPPNSRLRDPEDRIPFLYSDDEVLNMGMKLIGNNDKIDPNYNPNYSMEDYIFNDPPGLDLEGTEEFAKEIMNQYPRRGKTALMRLFDERLPFTLRPGAREQETINATKEAATRNFGYQKGGAIGDNTATSAMDALIVQAKLAELQKKNPISNYSMVDADRVDADSQALLDMVISMSIPGGGVASMAKGVNKNLPKLGKKFASMSPDKGKQEVLNKIASEMNVAPSRKVMQNPKRDLYNYKDYNVLEKKPEFTDAMDLINPGYLQKFSNRLVRAGKNIDDVKRGDVVDADFPAGFMNLNDVVDGFKKVPKKLQKEQAKELLNYFGVKNVRFKNKGGPIEKDSIVQNLNSFIPFDQRPNQAPASGDWGQSGAYMQSLMESMGMEDSLSGVMLNSDLQPRFAEPEMPTEDSLSIRDIMEFLKLQTMKRGQEATKEGMGTFPRGLFQ